MFRPAQVLLTSPFQSHFPQWFGGSLCLEPIHCFFHPQGEIGSPGKPGIPGLDGPRGPKVSI